MNRLGSYWKHGKIVSPYINDIEKITNEKNTEINWEEIMEFCTKARNDKDSAFDCIKSIMKKIGNRNPHVALQAITLLEAVATYCEKPFRLEIASREFENDYRKLLGNQSHRRVQETLKEMLRRWAEEHLLFKKDPQLYLIPSLYHQLKKEGIDFSSSRANSENRKLSSNTIPKGSSGGSTQQEKDDIAKAIHLSLQDFNPSSSKLPHRSTSRSNTSLSLNQTPSNLYPSANALMDLESIPAGAAGSSSSVTAGESYKNKEQKKVRAIYDFEAAEDNEMTFKAGEIVIIIDDSDVNWWKGTNFRGEGLFPSNFVTSNLNEEIVCFNKEKIKQQRRRFATINEEEQVAILREDASDVTKQPTFVGKAGESKIDQVIAMLNEADPTSLVSDPSDLITLEKQVNEMGPYIDGELELVDSRYAQLSRTSTDFVEALNLYHQLMHDGQTMQYPPYGIGLPNQYSTAPINSASTYIPYIPGGISSPQYQPQVYELNGNHPSISPLQQCVTQISPSHQKQTGTAPTCPHNVISSKQQPSAGNQCLIHVNGHTSEPHPALLTSATISITSHEQVQLQSAVTSIIQPESCYTVSGNASSAEASQPGN